MARRFDMTQPEGDVAFAAFLAEPRGAEADVNAVVAAILASVRAEGCGAGAHYTAQFYRIDVTPGDVRIPAADLDAAVDRCDPEDIAALRLAADRIARHHEKLRPSDGSYEDDAGVALAWRWTPVDAVGLYVPGGRAAYPSSVLMNAVPAKVAGVERIVMVTPTPGGAMNPLVLAAARVAGVEEVYRVGGAQAVAALAYGADPIPAVDKIVGPGNAYVAAAKRLVFGTVGIDTIAGPSEILVVADAANDPAWTAADLLSQAEHDPTSQSILITDNGAFADAVEAAVKAQLERLQTEATAREAWTSHGAIVVVEDLARDAPPLADMVAAEHLEIAAEDADAIAARVRHAGAIFLGRYTPEALGDYVTGSNHVLPTHRAARFASGLSTSDFMKRTSIQRASPQGLAAIGPAAARLARAEGLPAHAASVDVRLAAAEEG